MIGNHIDHEIHAAFVERSCKRFQIISGSVVLIERIARRV